MNRHLICLSLIGIAPLGSFLGEYLDGWGMIPENSGFVVAAAATFLFPWPIALLCAAISRAKLTARGIVFIGALAAQFTLLFFVIPPGATSEMMGIAHKFKSQFPVNELRHSAELMRQKFRDGTLVTHLRSDDDHFIVGESALVVADSELPDSLRGRFQRVYIKKVPGSDIPQIFFALGRDRGIVCDGRKNVREFFAWSMADGVEAYRYQRM